MSEVLVRHNEKIPGVTIHLRNNANFTCVDNFFDDNDLVAIYLHSKFINILYIILNE